MDKEHLLALRVMRLTKPSMLSTMSLQHENGDIFATNHDAAGHSFSTEQLLMLPQSFGNIFLGETFISYISVHNDSAQEATEVIIKADLQTGSQRISLAQITSDKPLPPDNSIDDVMRHEVKELGTHILACSVSYKNLSGTQHFFRKFFKFQVLKPLDVKTKFYNTEPDEVFLEAQIQNITNNSMCIDKINLEPSAAYASTPLNAAEGRSTFESQPYLKPKDTRQYLFRLQLKDPAKNQFEKSASAIGKLDIVWKTSLGERGRLQTSQLQRPSLAHSDIRVDVKKVPSEVDVMNSFDMMCEVTNCSERSRTLSVYFENHTNVLWKGISGFKLEKLGPQCSTSVNFSLLPITPGLLGISGLRIVDTEIDRTYEFDYIHHVLVQAKDVDDADGFINHSDSVKS